MENKLNNPKKSFIVIFLIVVVVIGCLLRYTGISWGLPIRLHPDEYNITRDAMVLASTHSFETKTYNRPNHVSIKINSLIYSAINKVVFDTSDEEQMKDNFKTHLSLFYTASRGLSAFWSVLSIFLAFLIGRKFHIVAGLISAALFAVYPSFVLHSHYITPETCQTFFMLLITYLAILYFERRNYLTLTLMCIVAAFAFCEKYPAVYCCITIAYAVIITHYKEISLLIKRAFYAVFIYALSIFMISPVLLIDIKSVMAILAWENRSTHLGADNLGLLGNFIYYFNMYIKQAGLILFILAIVGAIYCIKKHRKSGIVVVLGCLYIVPLSFTSLHWERWGVPMYAHMLLLSALGIYYVIWLVSKYIVPKIKKKSMATVTFVAAIAIVFVIPFARLMINASAKTASFTAVDTRIVSMAYCEDNGIDKQNTCYDGYTPLWPTNKKEIYESFNDYDITHPTSDDVEYAIVSSTIYLRYYAEPERYKEIISVYEQLKNECTEVMRFTPVQAGENDPIQSIKEIIQYINGGYSGPEIIIYKLN